MKSFKEWMDNLDKKAMKHLNMGAIPHTEYTIPCVMYTASNDLGDMEIGVISGITPDQFRKIADDLERYLLDYKLNPPASDALA